MDRERIAVSISFNFINEAGEYIKNMYSPSIYKSNS